MIVIAALMIVGFSMYSLLKLEWDDRYSDPPPSASHFNTYKLTLIDPAKVLDDIHQGKKLVLQIQPEPNPDNPPFITPIRWSQNDFLEVAQAYGKVIWQDDLNLWHLYKLSLYKRCDSSDGKFTDAEFLFYHEVTKGKEDIYSVRAIDLSPEYGQLRWGGDTYYSRPRYFGWTEIDRQNIAKISGEDALALADQRGGNEFRKSVNNLCTISVLMSPPDLKRMDWSVTYYGDTSSLRIWIPAK